ncbi:MAG TPA: hypothetical protein VKU01_34575 [Bryobacteraceae bacterium]|nr:hypothetical protein [Bryobacteraceae bacterium]
MFTTRNIPEHLWADVRRNLIFFFAHRCMRNAEDLAQDTLALILRRDDYVFQTEQDFRKLCYGFARFVILDARREESKHAPSEFDEHLLTPQPEAGLNATEMRVYLKEALAAGQSNLTEQEWKLIREALPGRKSPDGNAATELGHADANRTRVRLHRARRKLSRLIGWKE